MFLHTSDLIDARLRHQKLAHSDLRRPEDVVEWLGAVQAQDYTGAKWALGLRARVNDADVERAFTEGRILRTHVLRPTWHFVPPADLRWMQALTAPRVRAACASYFRRLELDHRTLARACKVFQRVLEGGHHKTRGELGKALARARIAASGIRLAFVMLHAELECLICSGAQRGTQLTYALVDERAPQTRRLTRDESLAELTRRYFSSHGPATVKDFVWWSGLTVKEATAGIHSSALAQCVIDDRPHWFVMRQGRVRRSVAASRAYLLPNYDEYFIAYKDRGAVVGARPPSQHQSRDTFSHLMVVNGRFAGTWMRKVERDTLIVQLAPRTRLPAEATQQLHDAAQRLGRFVGLPTRVETRGSRG